MSRPFGDSDVFEQACGKYDYNGARAKPGVYSAGTTEYLGSQECVSSVDVLDFMPYRHPDVPGKLDVIGLFLLLSTTETQ